MHHRSVLTLVLGIWTQALMLALQLPYQLSHYPNLCFNFQLHFYSVIPCFLFPLMVQVSKKVFKFQYIFLCIHCSTAYLFLQWLGINYFFYLWDCGDSTSSTKSPIWYETQCAFILNWSMLSSNYNLLSKTRSILRTVWYVKFNEMCIQAWNLLFPFLPVVQYIWKSNIRHGKMAKRVKCLSSNCKDQGSHPLKPHWSGKVSYRL